MLVVATERASSNRLVVGGRESGWDSTELRAMAKWDTGIRKSQG